MGTKHRVFTLEETCHALAMYVMGKKALEIERVTGMPPSRLYSLARSRGLLRKTPRATRKLDLVKIQQIAALYTGGMAVKDIMIETQSARHLVYMALNEAGLKLPDHKQRLFALTASEKSQLIELYEQGQFTGTELAQYFAISTATAYTTLKEAGVDRQNWSGPKARFVKYRAKNGRVCRFRSTWEEAFARHLDERELDWAYESHTWMLSDGTVYTPDFWVSEWNVFVEVKGMMTAFARTKIESFRQEYPWLKLIVLDRKAFKVYGIQLPQQLTA